MNQPLNAPQQNTQQWQLIQQLLQFESNNNQAYNSVNANEREDFTEILTGLMDAVVRSSVRDLLSKLNLYQTFLTVNGYLQGSTAFFLYNGILAFASQMNPNAPEVSRIAKEVKSLLPRRDTRTLSMVMYNCSVFWKTPHIAHSAHCSQTLTRHQ